METIEASERSSDQDNETTQLDSSVHIPIAQLTPLLPAPSSRSVKAIVTLIWPYSSSTRSLTVLLAEPDFRLRRIRGQVRVKFLGSSAKYVVQSKIGIGDEVTLGLDGVDWRKDEAGLHTPGKSVEWELEFTERLVMEVGTFLTLWHYE